MHSRINECFNINPTKPIMIIQNQCFGLWLWASGLLQFDVFGLHAFQDQRMLQYQSNKANNDYSKSLFRIVTVSQWAASVRCFRASCIPGSMNASALPIMIIQNQCFGFWLWASGLLQFDVFGLHPFQDQWLLQYQSNKANNDYSKSLFRIVTVSCFSSMFSVHPFQDQWMFQHRQ